MHSPLAKASHSPVQNPKREGNELDPPWCEALKVTRPRAEIYNSELCWECSGRVQAATLPLPVHWGEARRAKEEQSEERLGEASNTPLLFRDVRAVKLGSGGQCFRKVMICDS